MFDRSSELGRQISRATHPKPNYNWAEIEFIRAIFAVLPKNRHHSYLARPQETTVEPGSPWRQLQIGARVIRTKMVREWAHAGRVYELTVEKDCVRPEDWSWKILVTNNRWPTYKPVAKGETLESLHAWAGEKYPQADLPALLPVDRPVEIDWDQVRRSEQSRRS